MSAPKFGEQIEMFPSAPTPPVAQPGDPYHEQTPVSPERARELMRLQPGSASLPRWADQAIPTYDECGFAFREGGTGHNAAHWNPLTAKSVPPAPTVVEFTSCPRCAGTGRIRRERKA